MPTRRKPDGPALPMNVVRKLNDVRLGLLALHKALLEDARSQYEMDRGRISGSGALLQLVINDPWFAWLHQISETIVRIDDITTEPDVRALLEQVDRLLVPAEHGDSFARRYFEALQRQPAVVLAHGDVKRVLKTS